MLDPRAKVLTRLLESETNTMRGGDEGTEAMVSLRERVRGRRVVELGSGVGLCGIAAAAAGAHVMLTDLPAVVEARGVTLLTSVPFTSVRATRPSSYCRCDATPCPRGDV